MRNDIFEWMGETDQAVLKKYAAKATGDIVEVGVWKGASSLVMSKANPKAQIYSIDNYAHPYEEIYKIAQETLKGRKNVHLIHKSSGEAAKDWKTKISLLHIDADHSYEGVCKDIALWKDFVDGYILFHDYTAQVFDVKKAVEENFKEVGLEGGFAIVKV
jgi:hypothetical protein